MKNRTGKLARLIASQDRRDLERAKARLASLASPQNAPQAGRL
jgi:hypothetical protein